MLTGPFFFFRKLQKIYFISISIFRARYFEYRFDVDETSRAETSGGLRKRTQRTFGAAFPICQIPTCPAQR